jgi:hypothetical protein
MAKMTLFKGIDLYLSFPSWWNVKMLAFFKDDLHPECRTGKILLQFIWVCSQLIMAHYVLAPGLCVHPRPTRPAVKMESVLCTFF